MSTQLEMLARMVEAKRVLDALPPMPLPTQRMHPDDINELRDKVGLSRVDGPFTNIFGVAIIADESAERLPRIVPTNSPGNFGGS